MKKLYPYRFKTEAEFIKEFGKKWQKKLYENWNSRNEMDYLFGQPYPYYIKKYNIYHILYLIRPRHLCRNSKTIWYISWDMLTENVPNYKGRR